MYHLKDEISNQCHAAKLMQNIFYIILLYFFNWWHPFKGTDKASLIETIICFVPN